MAIGNYNACLVLVYMGGNYSQRNINQFQALKRCLENYTNRVFFFIHTATILLQMGIPKPMRVAKSRNIKRIFMKSKWNGELLQGMQELSMEASESIVGGESIFFWIGYGIGTVVNGVTSLFKS